MVILPIPSSFAFETAADNPRALKDAVGLTPSSLISRFGQPIAAPRRRASNIGVNPSPSVTALAASRTGITSK